MMRSRHPIAVVLAALVWILQAAAQGALPSVEDWLEEAGVQHGFCVALTESDARPALETVLMSDLFVHGLDVHPGAVANARSAAAAQGFMLDRFLEEEWNGTTLPHADNTVDVVFAWLPAERFTEGLRAEVLRVLRPGGKAFVLPYTGRSGATVVGMDVVHIEKPVPGGMDDWSHWEHGPDNNPVSTDSVIKAPYRTQWMGGPYYIAMPAITTMAGGRMFMAMGHIAHHRREEPWLNTLLARNGYNGAELWRRRLPDGYLVHRSAFIATNDAFYMITPDGNGVDVLDPETGRVLEEIRTPRVRGDWKWIALQDGVLYALVGKQPDPAETTLVRSDFPAWSWGELSAGYYADRVPWGFGETLMAYPLKEGKVAWTHTEEASIDSRGMAIGGGKVYFYAPDARLGRLDAATGSLEWVNEDAKVRALIEEPGAGLGSTPGFKSTALCVYSPEVLFYQAQTRQNLVAVSAADGRFLWSREKTTNNPNVIYLDGKAYVGIGPEGSTLELDPLTGKTIRDLGFAKRSCARLTATPDSLFVRGMPEGITRYDRATGNITFDGAMRPPCNDGIIGANGMLYIGSWLCDCGLALMGTAGLCNDPGITVLPAAERLTRNEAAPTDTMAGTDAGDWPDYRGSASHSGSTALDVSDMLFPVWTAQLEYPVMATAPIAAGKMIFTAGDDGIVRALYAETGQAAWTYATAGPIIQSPSYAGGRVYAGAGDGYVYCLDAATGELVWRFLAAPEERRIMLYGRLCSNWPVNTGILLHEGTAYFAAGLIDTDGTYIYALDAATGALKWCNDSAAHLNKELRKGVSAHGNLTIMGGKLWMAAGNVMPLAPFDLATGEYLGDPSAGAGAPRTNRGEEIGAFNDAFLVAGGKLRYSSVQNIVSPGKFFLAEGSDHRRDLGQGRIAPVWNETRLIMLPNREAPPQAYRVDASPYPSWPLEWTGKILDGQLVLGMALAKNFVVVTTEAPQFRSLQPEYRVYLLDAATGDAVSRDTLPGPPRLNGVAIDREGRILVALEDGGVACYGGEAAFRGYVDGIVGQAEAGTLPMAQAVDIVRAVMERVSHAEGRQFAVDRLTDLGYDIYDEARKNGAVRRWQLLAPVPWNLTENSLDKVWIGEPNVDTSKPAEIDGATLAWRSFNTADRNGRVNLATIYGSQAMVAAYAYAEIELPEAGPYLLKIGTNDGFKGWFNGEEVGRFDGGRSYRRDQDVFEVQGKAGKNTILLKVIQHGGAWDLGARVTRTDGSPAVFTQAGE